MPISLTESNVVVTLLECTLYGIFLVLSLASLFLLVSRQLGSTNPWLSTSSNGRRCSWPCSLAGYLSIIYTLAKSPFMVANILFMLTITAVSTGTARFITNYASKAMGSHSIG